MRFALGDFPVSWLPTMRGWDIIHFHTRRSWTVDLMSDEVQSPSSPS